MTTNYVGETYHATCCACRLCKHDDYGPTQLYHVSGRSKTGSKTSNKKRLCQIHATMLIEDGFTVRLTTH